MWLFWLRGQHCPHGKNHCAKRRLCTQRWHDIHATAVGDTTKAYCILKLLIRWFRSQFHSRTVISFVRPLATGYFYTMDFSLGIRRRWPWEMQLARTCGDRSACRTLFFIRERTTQKKGRDIPRNWLLLLWCHICLLWCCLLLLNSSELIFGSVLLGTCSSNDNQNLSFSQPSSAGGEHHAHPARGGTAPAGWCYVSSDAISKLMKSVQVFLVWPFLWTTNQYRFNWEQKGLAF